VSCVVAASIGAPSAKFAGPGSHQIKVINQAKQVLISTLKVTCK
jgi:hypothetical protein